MADAITIEFRASPEDFADFQTWRLYQRPSVRRARRRARRRAKLSLIVTPAIAAFGAWFLLWGGRWLAQGMRRMGFSVQVARPTLMAILGGTALALVVCVIWVLR